MRKTTKGNKMPNPLETVAAEVRNLFGGLALESRKNLEAALDEAKKENDALRAKVEEAAGTELTSAKAGLEKAKADAADELDKLKADLATAVKAAEPEVRTAVDAALSTGITKILAALA
jgi:molecular chaperone GrpE (heat shock protein)